MQVKKIAALCALAFAGLAGQAHAALTTAQKAALDDANANSRVIYISGASAVQKGYAGVINNLFTSGSATWYGDTADTTGSNYLAVAGTLTGTGSTWDGHNVIVIERFTGGSVYGVNSVARSESIATLNVTSGTCGATGAGTQANAYICPVAGTRVPDAGQSDVAPALFQSPINTEGETAADALSADELATLTSTPIYALAFGVAATTTVPTTVPLTRATVASIMAGNFGTWDQVKSGVTGDIVICRRTPGSGTQAVFNMYFGNYPCTGNFLVPADRYASDAWNDSTRTFNVIPNTGSVVVVENASSGDVKTCLSKAVSGGSYTTKDRSGNAVTVNFTAANNKAVGVLSMDSLNGSYVAGDGVHSTSSAWTFRNLDGAGQITWSGDPAVAPVVTGTGKNATISLDGTSGTYIDGTWDLQAMESFNLPSRTTGEKAKVLARFLEIAQNPSVHAAVSALKFVTAGIPGGAYSGARVQQAGYLSGDQCAPYYKQ